MDVVVKVELPDYNNDKYIFTGPLDFCTRAIQRYIVDTVYTQKRKEQKENDNC